MTSLRAFLILVVISYASWAHAMPCARDTIAYAQIPGDSAETYSTVSLPNGISVRAGLNAGVGVYEISLLSGDGKGLRKFHPSLPRDEVLMSAACISNGKDSAILLAFQIGPTGYSGDYYAIYGNQEILVHLARATQARLLIHRGNINEFIVIEPETPWEGSSDWDFKMYESYQLTILGHSVIKKGIRKSVGRYNPRTVSDTPIALDDFADDLFSPSP